LNYLKPGIKRGQYSEDEEDLIIKLHRLLGNRQVKMCKYIYILHALQTLLGSINTRSEIVEEKDVKNKG
jgi:hypothetical protein